MMWELRQVAPADLHAAWALAKPGLERVRIKANASWLCEDVFAAIRTGRATLHMGYLDEQYVGCVVLTINMDPFSNERSVLVWALYTGGGQDRDKPEPGLIPVNDAILHYGLADVKEIARKAGINKIRFHSPRAGWIRRLGELGFQIVERVFEATL